MIDGVSSFGDILARIRAGDLWVNLGRSTAGDMLLFCAGVGLALLHQRSAKNLGYQRIIQSANSCVGLLHWRVTVGPLRQKVVGRSPQLPRC